MSFQPSHLLTLTPVDHHGLSVGSLFSRPLHPFSRPLHPFLSMPNPVLIFMVCMTLQPKSIIFGNFSQTYTCELSVSILLIHKDPRYVVPNSKCMQLVLLGLFFRIPKIILLTLTINLELLMFYQCISATQRQHLCTNNHMYVTGSYDAGAYGFDKLAYYYYKE